MGFVRMYLGILADGMERMITTMKLPWKLPLVVGGRAKPASADTLAAYRRDPARLADEVRSYAAAGCGIVRAPTAGANRILLEKDGLGGEVQAINTELVAAVKQAAGGSLTAGCLGPTGLQAEPHGDTPVTALIAVYAEQAKALRDAGCEVLLCEGMTSLNEARAALLAARETRLPVIVILRVDRQGETATGTRLLPAVITLQALGAAAVGIEADAPAEEAAEWIEEALDYAAVPLAAFSSAAPGETQEAYLERMHTLLDAGTAIVGGTEVSAAALEALCRLADEHAIVAAPEIDTDAAAGEHEAFFLGEDLSCSEPLVCDSCLEDALIEAEEEYNAARVELAVPEDIPRLLEASQVCRLPIVITTDRALLLDEALLRYPGRLLVDSLGGIERTLIDDIAAQYGAVVF